MSARRKPDLSVRWSKRDRMLTYTGRRAPVPLYIFFECIESLDKPTLVQELERRGYDIETLRFSIRKRGAK